MSPLILCSVWEKWKSAHVMGAVASSWGHRAPCPTSLPAPACPMASPAWESKTLQLQCALPTSLGDVTSLVPPCTSARSSAKRPPHHTGGRSSQPAWALGQWAAAGQLGGRGAAFRGPGRATAHRECARLPWHGCQQQSMGTQAAGEKLRGPTSSKAGSGTNQGIYKLFQEATKSSLPLCG